MYKKEKRISVSEIIIVKLIEDRLIRYGYAVVRVKDYSNYSKAIPYKETRKSFGMVLFIGFFIAFLFFIASGSIIYFKLFNEIKQDGMEYGILKKIGTTNNEIRDIITKQIGIIFFLPFIVSTSHFLFALKSLSSLMMRNLLTNGLIVMIGYLIFQILYFMIIRAIYINKIKYTMVGS